MLLLYRKSMYLLRHLDWLLWFHLRREALIGQKPELVVK